jgi:hypothetical protein
MKKEERRTEIPEIILSRALPPRKKGNSTEKLKKLKSRISETL